jgi:RNA polymerase sigma factor for flagellar operon FliA
VKPVATAVPPDAWTPFCDGQFDPGAETWASYCASGDTRLREQLVELYTPYARIIAARMYRRRGGLAAEFTDYMQSALLGLLRAIDRYDLSLAIPFVHFAARHIRGAVLDALPSMSELNAQVLGRRSLRQDRVASLVVGVGAAQGTASLDKLSGLALELGIGFLLEDAGIFQQPPDQPDQRCYDDHRRRELSTAFGQLLPLLPERQSRLLCCHYFCDMRFAEIAELMGLSVARVSQLHRVALKGLLALSQRVGHLDLSG